MKRRHRAFVLAASAVAVAVVGVVACKEETVSSVTIDLGLGNRGSLGFACTEDRTASCADILECSLKPGPQSQNACFSALCRSDSAAGRDCATVAECLRKTDASGADCYAATCQRPQPLIDRARDGDGGADVHLFVDYIGLGGTPGCRVNELRGWCADGRCKPIRRRCVAVHLDPSDLATPASWPRAISDGLARQRVLDDDAPDTPVLVRIFGVAKAGACTPAEEEPSVLPAEPLVGCAYSCPTVLSVARGALTVDFEVFGNTCTDRVLEECVGVFSDAGAR